MFLTETLKTNHNCDSHRYSKALQSCDCVDLPVYTSDEG